MWYSTLTNGLFIWKICGVWSAGARAKLCTKNQSYMKDGHSGCFFFNPIKAKWHCFFFHFEHLALTDFCLNHTNFSANSGYLQLRQRFHVNSVIANVTAKIYIQLRIMASHLTKLPKKSQFKEMLRYTIYCKYLCLWLEHFIVFSNYFYVVRGDSKSFKSYSFLFCCQVWTEKPIQMSTEFPWTNFFFNFYSIKSGYVKEGNLSAWLTAVHRSSSYKRNRGSISLEIST